MKFCLVFTFLTLLSIDGAIRECHATAAQGSNNPPAKPASPPGKPAEVPPGKPAAASSPSGTSDLEAHPCLKCIQECRQTNACKPASALPIVKKIQDCVMGGGNGQLPQGGPLQALFGKLGGSGSKEKSTDSKAPAASPSGSALSGVKLAIVQPSGNNGNSGNSGNNGNNGNSGNNGKPSSSAAGSGGRSG